MGFGKSKTSDASRKSTFWDGSEMEERVSRLGKWKWRKLVDYWEVRKLFSFGVGLRLCFDKIKISCYPDLRV